MKGADRSILVQRKKLSTIHSGIPSSGNSTTRRQQQSSSEEQPHSRKDPPRFCFLSCLTLIGVLFCCTFMFRSSESNGTSNGRQTLVKVSKAKLPIVPQGKWPVSIRDDDGSFETIKHPGDSSLELSVPRFWSRPIHSNGLISREAAMLIGTCLEADSRGDHVRGDACPVHQRTIFVGIASYRDYQCRETVESVFSRAAHPERVRVGVVDQVIDGEDLNCNDPPLPCAEHPEQMLCKYRNQIDVYTMDARMSVGPVFARHIGHRLYRGEYYATQLDAHVSMVLNWDEDIISQIDATKNEMAVLSTYLSDVEGSLDEQGHSLVNTRPIMCNTIYEQNDWDEGTHLRHSTQPERQAAIVGSPQLQPWWAAGYSFSRGHFIVNVPYDQYQPMIFQGEEMSIGIRGFTIGYDFYAPERSVCFHHYAEGKNQKKRNTVPSFWENSDHFKDTGTRAMARLLGLVHMTPEVDPTSWDHTEEEYYGIGQVRTPEKFYETYGINVVNKTIEAHLCRFVNDYGKMHKAFTPFLRKDGMGIDYSYIDYKYHDPDPQDESWY